MERSSEEEAEGRVLDDVGVDAERDVAYLHLEVLGAPEGPVCCTVRAFHLEAYAGVDACRDFVCQILSDGDDLRAGVNDACFCGKAAD